MNPRFNSASLPIPRGDFGRDAARASDWKQREALLLASYAMFGRDSKGRRYAEEPHPYRGPFQRDGIVLPQFCVSAAERQDAGLHRGYGDYHRTRLTHTQEVATMTRTSAAYCG